MSALTRDSPRIIRQRILSFSPGQDGIGCVLANHSKVLLPRLLASHAAIGDEIIFPIPDREVIGAEVYLTKAPSLPLSNCFYLAPIGYATQPQLDKRDQTFVSARVQQDLLGISSIVLPCDTLREYFYGIDDSKSGSVSSTLYQLLRVATAASPAEIRVAYKLRTLELKSIGAAQAEEKNWGALSTFLGTLSCALAMTPCLETERRRPSSRMADLGRYWYRLPQRGNILRAAHGGFRANTGAAAISSVYSQL